MAGFHAQRISTLKGSFGCVQYSVRDKLDNVKAYVAIAWGQPLLFGAFHCHVAVGRTKIDGEALAQTCEDRKKLERHEKAFPNTSKGIVCLQQNEKAISEVCDASDAMNPDSNITISGDETLTPFITVRTGGLDGTTAELFVAVKGDRIAKVAEDSVNSLPIEG
ncbi:hypothetical protein Poli38472_007073 [Pythium oligandrum]|uniref:Uncharacterized protein n=1 Tax=Pythium oligandrum TaxID=41045 RepID=A0A8K1CA30_PYTOL|nr:hypothetical protein Poli38472_007073 [Pythium oligandrum]|eukprot:TMW58928.1 hypothetical protein Poli38472_007073 [Pythium oligandrum]